MAIFPSTINDLPVLFWSPIDDRHEITGECLHFNLATGAVDPPPSFVAIVAESTSFYLLRLDKDRLPITDTWHETLDEAFAQAEFEYRGIQTTWQKIVDSAEDA